MVYCGKPSRACHVCRARHTRCDAKPEGCTQCARARRPCPGYRKEEDLLFRNENEKVARKVTAREKEREPSGKADGSSSLATQSRDLRPSLERELIKAQHSRFEQLSLSIKPNVEELAECYFNCNFLTGLGGPSFGFVERLIALYRPEATEEHLLRSFRAVGLASFGYHVRDSGVLNASQHEYVKAIQLTNMSLKSPVDAVKDSTLISTLLLGMFEIITASSMKSVEAWAHHIKGAAALIKLRGFEQVQTREGCELFCQASAGLINACIQRRLPVPEGVVEMSKIVYKSKVSVEPTSIQVALTTLRLAYLRFTQFRAALEPESDIDIESALIEALEIDRAISSVSLNPPNGWQYETHSSETASQEVVFHQRFHVYPSVRIASFWNNMRTMRNLIHIQIFKLLLLDRSRVFPTLTMESHRRQLRSSIEVVRKMQIEVLSSVPYHLGFVKGSDSDGYQITHTPTVRAGDGYFLMWSLFTTGLNVVKSKDVEAHCVRWLDYIAWELGIQQAAVLARAVDTRTPVHPSTWGVMAMDVYEGLPESERCAS